MRSVACSRNELDHQEEDNVAVAVVGLLFFIYQIQSLHSLVRTER